MSIATPDTPLLTVEEVAKTLKLSVRTVWSMISKGELASVKVAGVRRIAQSVLDEYLARQTQPLREKERE